MQIRSQKAVLLVLVGLLAASCATAARMTIEQRLGAIGLGAKQAKCMATELDERLDNKDLQDVARYTVGLARADTPGAALDALLKIDNPRAVKAIGGAGLACILSSF